MLGIIVERRYRRTVFTQLDGEVIRAGDDQYDSARGVFNAMIDRRPLAVLRCHDSSDVGRTIAFARRRHLPLSVKAAVTTSPATRCATTA